MLTSIQWRICGVLGIALLTGCAREPATPASPVPATSGQGLQIGFTGNPDPLRAGSNSVEVMVKQPDGTPVTDASVTAVFYMAAMPSMNMPEMRSTFTLNPVGNGLYRGDGELVMSGNWDVTVTVQREGVKLGTRKLTVVAK